MAKQLVLMFSVLALACAIPMDLRIEGMATNCTGKMEGNPMCPAQWVCYNGQCLPRGIATQVRPWLGICFLLFLCIDLVCAA